MLPSDKQSQRLSLALKGAKCGLWDWDIAAGKTYFDPNYFLIAGYEPDEFPHLYDEWEKRIHPDDVAAAVAAIQQYISGATETYTVEFRFKTKSGDWMWILAQGEVTEWDKNDKPVRFVGLHIDINERKLVEQELRAERDFSKNLLNTAQTIVLVLDVEGRIQTINPYMEELSGYSLAEVKGRDWFDTFLPAADHSIIREVFQQAVSDVLIRGQVNSFLTKDGRVRQIDWYNKTLKDSKEHVVGMLCVGQDITESKAAEEALKDSRNRLASIIEGTRAGTWEWNVQTGETVFNEEWAKIIGYTLDELAPISVETWMKYAHPEDLQKSEGLLKRHFNGELNYYEFESRMKHKNGDWVWVLDRGKVASYTADGKPLWMFGTHQDITANKQAEKVLKNAAYEWRLIMDEFDDVIYLLDNDRYLVRANLAFYTTTKTTPEQAIGRHIAELIHPQGKVCGPICQVQEERRDFSMVMEADDENNPLGKPLDIKVKIVRDKEGAATGILMTLHDLTQARLTEQTLRESEQNFRLLADYTYDWEYWLNPEGKYAYVSPSCERITGYRPAEFMSNPKLIFDLVMPDYAEAIHQHYADENNVKTPLYSMEFPIRTKAGEERWLEHHCSPVFDEHGNYAGRRGNNRDITDRKQAEQERLDLENQLRLKYKMEAVGVMAGGIAHNFNNNLSIILGNVELSKIKMASNPEIDGYLSNAKIAVLRSRDLIQQILTYSRQGIKDKTSIQLSLVIDETLKLLHSTVPTTINLQQRINNDSHDLTIDADSSQIQECLINLCNNAMYAMEEEGDLTIALDSVELREHDIPAQYESRPGHYAKLSVQDDGSGMSAETVDKIFDLFFTTKPVDEGTGVGLSTVQGIVTQHGGLVKVRSRLGEGTTFELYFPVTEQVQTIEAPPVNENLPKGAERILFIDDDEMLVKLGEVMLQEMGYQVTTMTNSTEALKLFSANSDQFDLVITDQTMPGLTGEHLIQEIKKISPDIPAIICTGYSSKIDGKTIQELDVSAFLMKPLDMPILLQVVRRVLDGK